LRTHTFAEDFYTFRRRKPRRVKSLRGDALVRATAAFDALRSTVPVMQDMIQGRLILPELQTTECPRTDFGRPCNRVDYHHHDEAFGGGGDNRYFTQSTSPAPRRSASISDIKGMSWDDWRTMIEDRKREREGASIDHHPRTG